MLEAFYLLGIILTPLILTTAIIISCLGTHSLKLNADNKLIEQGLLWLSILLPLFYFLVLSGVIWSEYEVDISSKGLITFFKITAVPLAILSLSLPLAVLVSRFYAAELTTKHIAVTIHKNNMDAFYSHRNELFSYFDRIVKVGYFGALDAKFDIHPRTHKIFFSGAPEKGLPEVNSDKFLEIENLLKRAREGIDSVIKNKTPKITLNIYLEGACVAIHNLGLELGLPEIYQNLADKGIVVEVEGKNGELLKFLTAGTTTDHLVAAYRYCDDYFLHLCDFAGVTRKNIPKEQHYIITGDKFRTMKAPGTVEQLHKNEINNMLNKQ